MSQPTGTQLEPAIQRIPVGKLRVFELSEAELEALERGSPEALFLNLAIATFSISVSLFASLLTATIANSRVFTVFVVVTTISFISSITFAFLWALSRRSLKKVSAEIRSRIPPEGVQEAPNGSEAG